jgi:dolichol kinase
LWDNHGMGKGQGYNRAVRKLLHIAGGAPALALPYIPYWLALAAAAAALSLSLALKPTHSSWLRIISKPRDRIRGVITGLRGYASVVLALLILWGALLLAGSSGLITTDTGSAVRYIMLGWLALGVGDGLAGLLGPGPSEGRTVPWSKSKTWWGAVGCFLGTLGAYVASFGLHFSIPGHDSLPQLVVFGVIVAVLTTLTESLDSPVDDNYLVGFGAPFFALILHLFVA